MKFTSGRGKFNLGGKIISVDFAPAPPICGTETGALHQGKAIHFQIGLCSYSDLWP